MKFLFSLLVALTLIAGCESAEQRETRQAREYQVKLAKAAADRQKAKALTVFLVFAGIIAVILVAKYTPSPKTQHQRSVDRELDELIRNSRRNRR